MVYCHRVIVNENQIMSMAFCFVLGFPNDDGLDAVGWGVLATICAVVGEGAAGRPARGRGVDANCSVKCVAHSLHTSSGISYRSTN